jgi:hypothetical protein
MADEQITFNAETAKLAEKKSQEFLGVLRGLRDECRISSRSLEASASTYDADGPRA